MQAKRYVFAAAAVLFAVGVVAQVFLAGMAVFGAGPWDDHIEFGYLVAIFPVLLIGLSLLARAGRTTVWLSILTLVVAQVQTILPWFRNDVPWIAALHPVNAMVVFGLGAIVTRRAISVARSPGRPHAAAVPAAPRVRPMNWYPWLVLAHVLGAFGFMLAHGVSAHVAFKLRSEREPARVAALLDLSSYSLTLFYSSVLVLLAAGIAGGFVGNHWGRLWIWSSIGILLVLVAAMYALASPYYNRLRRAVGMRVYGDAKDAAPPDPLPVQELALLLDSSRPLLVAIIGALGLVLIIGLMVIKPF